MPASLPERRIQTVCLLVLAVVAAGAALHWLAPVMIPFALATFLAIGLAPVVDGLEERTRLPRPFAVGLAMVLGALLLIVLGGVVATSVGEFSENQDAYRAKLDELKSDLVDLLPAGMREQAASAEQDALDAASGLVMGLMGVVGNLLSQGASVLVFLLFLLVEQSRKGGGAVAGAVSERVKRYISVKISTSALTGVLVGGTLMVLGVDAAVLFGLLSFLLNFIPTLGSIVAVLLPIPILLVGDLGVARSVLAIVLPAAIQFAVGQIYENKKLGDEFDLRASIVLLALVVWGKVWGVVGMLLATPITAVLKTSMEDWDVTRPVARLMGQRYAARESEKEDPG